MQYGWVLIVAASVAAGLSGSGCAGTGDDAATGAGGTGGSGGAGGAGGSGGDASLPACDDGTTFPRNPADRHCFTIEGSAGAIGYVRCSAYEAAGLSTFACSPDAGAGDAKALVQFCQHADGVPTMSFLDQALASCVQDTGVATSTWPTPALLAAGICDPELPAKLLACAEGLNVCPRAPLCVDGGTWGCDDIVAACPALTATACRGGFDSKTHEARVAIHDCMKTATGDCVEDFRRCAWGL